METFPPPESEQVRQRQQTEELSNLTAALDLGTKLIFMEALPDGAICAAVQDWPSFLHFKNEYQAFSDSDFFISHTETVEGKFIQRSYCRCVCVLSLP